MHFGRSLHARAFTMIEALVVIVIIAVVSAAVVPRAFRTSDREARASLDNLAELLSVAARRDAYASQPIALSGDAASQRVELWSRNQDPVNGQLAWTADILTPAATLSGIAIRAVTIDGADYDPRKWWYEFPQNVRRPTLVLTVASEVTEETWTVELLSGASRAVIVDGSGQRPIDEVGTVDLDAVGRAEAPW
ncbi:MAG: prepilin-type N-terminal cleavage/methylation domain-containing protein [Phycisphaerales bacterium]